MMAKDQVRTGLRPFAKLVLENVRCFESAEIPLDEQVTVVIGDKWCWEDHNGRIYGIPNIRR